MPMHHFYPMTSENAQNFVVGFICVGDSARVPGGYSAGIYNDNSNLDIGLGLRPDLTGKGLGQGFMSDGISFLDRQFRNVNYRLVVAEFNERAIKTYERTGYVKGIRFNSKVQEQEVSFISMNYTGPIDLVQLNQ